MTLIPNREARLRQPLRWKTRFQTGDDATDRQKRAFFDCLNSLIDAAGHREHCQEMEDFLRFAIFTKPKRPCLIPLPNCIWARNSPGNSWTPFHSVHTAALPAANADSVISPSGKLPCICKTRLIALLKYQESDKAV